MFLSFFALFIIKTYTLMTKLQPHRTNENLVFEAPSNRGESERLSATTIFPYTDPKEGFAILVSYEAKVKRYIGVLLYMSCVIDIFPFCRSRSTWELSAIYSQFDPHSERFQPTFLSSYSIRRPDIISNRRAWNRSRSLPPNHVWSGAFVRLPYITNGLLISINKTIII